MHIRPYFLFSAGPQQRAERIILFDRLQRLNAGAEGLGVDPYVCSKAGSLCSLDRRGAEGNRTLIPTVQTWCLPVRRQPHTNNGTRVILVGLEPTVFCVSCKRSRR